MWKNARIFSTHGLWNRKAIHKQQYQERVTVAYKKQPPPQWKIWRILPVREKWATRKIEIEDFENGPKSNLPKTDTKRNLGILLLGTTERSGFSAKSFDQTGMMPGEKSKNTGKVGEERNSVQGIGQTSPVPKFRLGDRF